jgi:phosphomannomutase
MSISKQKSFNLGEHQEMTVRELIELLKQQNQDAIVYHDYDGDIALMVSEVSVNVVGSQEETVLLS